MLGRPKELHSERTLYPAQTNVGLTHAGYYGRQVARNHPKPSLPGVRAKQLDANTGKVQTAIAKPNSMSRVMAGKYAKLLMSIVTVTSALGCNLHESTWSIYVGSIYNIEMEEFALAEACDGDSWSCGQCDDYELPLGSNFYKSYGANDVRVMDVLKGYGPG